MNVLIACEFSGEVRDAFRALGHNAYSCDLPEVEPEGIWPEFHYRGDARYYVRVIRWCLVIAHPPCTYLANSGVKHMYNGASIEGGINAERYANMLDGAQFFADMWNADAERVCVENPVMHGMAMDAIRELCDDDPFADRQFVHPHMFGYKEVKATGLSLRKLPRLSATKDVKAETMALPYAQRAKVHYMSPGPNRTANRSRTNPGLAEAMAAQWGILG